ncbi:MAG: histidine triad family protein [Patescibacteria group bacterium]|nr:histidine triad family protein [Patescibacteria group bacterium]
MTETSVFTKIRLREIPGEIIYQDELIFVPMTIAPHNPGHCLVVPIEEIGNFEEVPEKLYLHIMKVAQHIARVQRRLYDCPKVALAAVGMSVDHTHIHVFPLYAEKDMDPDSAKQPPAEEIALEADRLRTALKENPPA